MSLKIVEKRQKRAALVTEARQLLDESEKRGMTQEDNQKYDRMIAEVDRLFDEITREERQLELEAEMAQKEARNVLAQSPEQREDVARIASEEYRSAFNKWMKFGVGQLNSEERQMIMAEQRALAIGTNSAGGYTVPQGFYDKLMQAQKFYGGMRQANTTKLTTTMGNPLPIATNDDTGNMGAILAENAAAGTATDPVFGQKLLQAWKYTSKTVLVSLELLQDSAFDLETWMTQRLGERIGRIVNNHFTLGTGSSQPTGVVTAATAGKTGLTGQTTSIIYDDLIDLIHSVDIAYRQNAQFMMHDSSLKAIKKLKDSQGRPLWLPGLAMKEPDTINGFPYIVNNDIAVMAANAKSVLFGDFSTYYIRDVMDVQVIRIAEKYIESGQVGFIAFSRCDGNLIDAGQGPVRYYANSAT